jgi:hypothetical protein
VKKVKDIFKHLGGQLPFRSFSRYRWRSTSLGSQFEAGRGDLLKWRFDGTNFTSTNFQAHWGLAGGEGMVRIKIFMVEISLWPTEKQNRGRKKISQRTHTRLTHTRISKVIVSTSQILRLQTVCAYMDACVGRISHWGATHTRISCKHTQFGGAVELTLFHRFPKCGCGSFAYAVHQCKVVTFSFFQSFLILCLWPIFMSPGSEFGPGGTC